MNRAQVLAEIEKAQKATQNGYWIGECSVRLNFIQDAKTNYLAILRQHDAAMVILRRKHDDDHPGWRTCPCADAEKIRAYFGD